MLYYVYGLIDGEWQPIDGKWLGLDEARTSTYLAIQRGATAIGTYTWNGTNMTWSIGS
jgi:hypothetical protein